MPPQLVDSPVDAIPARRRLRDVVELFVAYGLILLTIWTPNPWQRVFYWSAITWVVLATYISFDGWRAMGFRIGGFWRSLWIFGAALIMTMAAVVLASHIHTLHAPGTPTAFIGRFFGYGIWSLMQQFLLQSFFLLRLLRLLPGKSIAVLAAGGLFALAHLPNPILAPTALIWGLAASFFFLKYRNIYILGMTHAVLGICVAITIPGRVDHNMRVGLGYLTYNPHHHHRSHRDHTVSTVACVIADAATRRS